MSTFAAYRHLASSSGVGYRRTGILDEPGYESAMASRETVVTEFPSGDVLPVAVAGHEALALGYEPARLEALGPATHPPFVLAIGVSGLTSGQRTAVATAIRRAGPLRVFFPDTPEGDERNLLRQALERVRCRVHEVPILDQRASHPEASLVLYEAYAPLPSGQARGVLMKDLHHREIPETGIRLVAGPHLSEHELGDLWDVFRRRFSYLGDHHPISMEDTEANFRELACANSTVAVIGEIAARVSAFAFVTDDFGLLHWLDFDRIDFKPGPSLHPLFFPGVVSDAKGQRLAAEILFEFTSAAARAGMAGHLLFEVTNLSDDYIPRIVKRVLERVAEYSGTQLRCLSKTVFRQLVVTPAL